MILTTNRATNIDAAFESRVDIILPYQTLTEEAKFKIWKNFLNGKVCEDEIRGLSKEDLNGRHIKSAVKSALIMSRYAASNEVEPEPLITYLKQVVELRKQGKAMIGQQGGEIGKQR